jgi:hypothetical protein
MSKPIVSTPLNRAQRGKAPKLSWAKWVEDSIRNLSSQPSPPNRQINTKSEPLQFKIYGVRYDTEAEKWFCKVRPGWVRSRNPDSDATEPIKDWMPTAGDPAVALDTEEPPEIEIADGQTVYCRVTTTAKGIIEEAPTVEAAATPEAGVHFQPPNQETEGDLYFPLCNVTIEGDPEVVTLEQIQQGGPIDVVPNLPELKSVGDEREVFKGRVSAGDTYDFRTLKQVEPDPDGLAIIKPEPEDDTEAGELETIDFKFITQKATQPQVQIEDVDDGEGIRVKGNDYDTAEAGVRKFTIDIKDGLVTSLTKDASGDGWWGTVGIQFDPNGGTLQTLELDFEDGSLVDVRCSQGVTGDGTQASEGFVNFQIGDTDT